MIFIKHFFISYHIHILPLLPYISNDGVSGVQIRYGPDLRLRAFIGGLVPDFSLDHQSSTYVFNWLLFSIFCLIIKEYLILV